MVGIGKERQGHLENGPKKNLGFWPPEAQKRLSQPSLAKLRIVQSAVQQSPEVVGGGVSLAYIGGKWCGWAEAW
jgi:hypothetical protein